LTIAPASVRRARHENLAYHKPRQIAPIAIRQLVGDLFSGAQDYTTLKQRVLGHLGISLSQFVSSVLSFEPASVGRVPRGSNAHD